MCRRQQLAFICGLHTERPARACVHMSPALREHFPGTWPVSCRKGTTILEPNPGELVEYLREQAAWSLENDFALQEFLDRYWTPPCSARHPLNPTLFPPGGSQSCRRGFLREPECPKSTGVRELPRKRKSSPSESRSRRRRCVRRRVDAADHLGERGLRHRCGRSIHSHGDTSTGGTLCRCASVRIRVSPTAKTSAVASWI